VTVGGRGFLATTNFRDAKLWDATTGLEGRVLHGHRKPIRSMTPIVVDGREVLATASADGDVRIWNPGDGECVRVLSGHTDSINSICTIEIGQHVFLATASRDRTARLWDLTADDITRGRARPVSRVSDACAVRVGARQLVATVDGNTGTIRLQDAETGAERATLGGYAGPVNSMCMVPDGHQELIATANDGRVLQAWDPRLGKQLVDRSGRFEQLQAICAFRDEDGSHLLAVAGNRRGIQFCQATTGRVVRRRRMPTFLVPDDVLHHLNAIQVIHHVIGNGISMLATAGEDEIVMLWDQNGQHRASLPGHRRNVSALATLSVDGQTLLATAGEDQTIRIWDPRGYRCLHVLTGHTDGINSLCPVTVGGRPMLASGSRDRTVKLWDPATGSLKISIPVHYPALACLEVSGQLFVGLTAGSLALDLNTRDTELPHFREI
jgi:WD40 repeat protein